MQFGIFIALTLGFLSGIISGMFILPSQIIEHVWSVILIVIISSVILKKVTRSKNIFPIMFFLIIGGSVGLWRISVFHADYPFEQLIRFHDTTITVVGRIHKPPELFPDKQIVVVTPKIINGEKMPIKTQKMSVRTTPNANFTAGDYVIITGKFRARDNFISDSDRVVPYRMMSYAKKIAGDIYFPTKSEVVKKEPNTYTFLSKIKVRFLESLNSTFVLPASGLLAGMMIGDTSSLNADMLDVFRMVGLIHIVVLSGYNITLIANTFVKIFASRGYYQRLFFAMIALVVFIGIVGISQTALRAGIMALCVFLAQYYIRPYMITRALLIALVVMVWFSPYAILYDLSLQLSFLATLGIVYVFPFFEKRYEQFSKNILGEIILQTVAVNLVVLPLILYKMGTVSPVFLPLNMLVLGFVPFLTIGGFIVTLLGLVIPQVAIILAYPIQYMTDAIINLAGWTAEHDPFYTTLPVFPVVWIGIYYGIFLYILMRLYAQKNIIDAK